MQPHTDGIEPKIKPEKNTFTEFSFFLKLLIISFGTIKNDIDNPSISGERSKKSKFFNEIITS